MSRFAIVSTLEKSSQYQNGDAIHEGQHTGWKTASSAIPADPEDVSQFLAEKTQLQKFIPEPSRRAIIDSFLTPFAEVDVVIATGGDIVAICMGRIGYQELGGEGRRKRRRRRRRRMARGVFDRSARRVI
jgi:hypothetical protein